MHYETPAAASLFTRYFSEVVDWSNLIAVPRGFQSFFGNPATGGQTRFVMDAKTLDFDVRNGQQGVTTLVHRGNVAEPINKAMLVGGNFTSFNRAFPLGEDEGIVSADQILERAFGEQPYQTLTRVERMRRLGRDIVDEMIRRAIRTQEILAAQMIRTGKQDLIIGTTSADERLDTKRLGTHTASPSGSWANIATSILTDMDSMATLIQQDAGTPADGMIVGADLPKYIAQNTEILAAANLAGPGTSGVQIVYFGDNVRPGPQFNRMIANGFNAICQLVTFKGRRITVFTYEGGYVASATFTPYIPDDYAIMFSSQARCDRYFGPPERLNDSPSQREDYQSIFGFNPEAVPMPPNVGGVGDVIVPAEFHFDARRSLDNKSLRLGCQWAPVYITMDTNAFVTMDTVP